MKGDFSRLTFAPAQHYRRVLMQQGRVEIDADGNEQVAIDRHVAATTATDVIGQAGYPAGTLPGGQPAGGFALSLSAGGADLAISPGRLYVDGLLVENDTPAATLLHQPDLPAATLAGLGAPASGVYGVYLDVWERLITALDDPAIRETALGGPDTSVRSKLVWQVRLGAVAASRDGAPPTCAGAGEPWPAASTGTLSAGTAPPGGSLPCILPPDTGYRRLENQLYRVEIHAPGTEASATFVWSRENGSVVCLIGSESGGATTATGPDFWVTGLNDDVTLGLQAGDWVELTDDATELAGLPGTLYQVKVTPTDGHHVSLSVTGAPPVVTLALRPKLRRWDQSGPGVSATGDLALPVAAPIELEGGVQVRFGAGTYRTGDYWLIPARTATSVQQGAVEWPVDAAAQPVFRPAFGIHHHYAMLGLVAVTAPAGSPAALPAGTFAGLGAAPEPVDCRVPFPPLTGLPGQKECPCTIVVKPGPGWEQPVLAYFQSGGKGVRLDAEICFPVGAFPVSAPLLIAGAGHIRVNGAGWGTRVVAADAAVGSVMAFTGCTSVAVRDLYAEAHAVGGGRGPRAGINGVLDFADCGEVTVQECWLRCGSAVSARGAACVSVLSTESAANATTGAGAARIAGCLLHVGEMQVGIQLSHQERATVQDNEIAVDPALTRTTLANRLADAGYLAVARSYLVSSVTLAPPPPAAPPPAAAPPPPAAPLPPAAPSAQRPAGASPGIVRAAEGAVPPAQSATAPVAGRPAPAPHSLEAEVLAAPVASLEKAALRLAVGNQTLSVAADPGLQTSWQQFLGTNAPKTFATANDAIRFVKKSATALLTTPAARAGLSGFSAVLHTLNEHVALAGRGIVVGGRAIGELTIAGNSIAGVLMGISVGVSHKASAAETAAKQRTPDRMGTIRVAGNVVACQANDVAVKSGRFGIFVGSAGSLEIEGNRVTLTPAGIKTPPVADAIRVVGYLGARAVIRHNHVTGFAMGIRVVPLSGAGPGTRAQGLGDVSYTSPEHFGPVWLVADNAIERASRVPTPGPFWPTKAVPAVLPAPFIDAPQCLRVGNGVVL